MKSDFIPVFEDNSSDEESWSLEDEPEGCHEVIGDGDREDDGVIPDKERKSTIKDANVEKSHEEGEEWSVNQTPRLGMGKGACFEFENGKSIGLHPSHEINLICSSLIGTSDSMEEHEKSEFEGNDNGIGSSVDVEQEIEVKGPTEGKDYLPNKDGLEDGLYTSKMPNGSSYYGLGQFHGS
ncbi:hypothetical protein SLA2020_193780 [Shorea laevis]